MPSIWTLLKIIGPIMKGIPGAMAASRRARSGAAKTLPLTERDIPIGIVGGSILVLMVPIGLLLYAFAGTDPIASHPDRDDRRQHRLHPRSRAS